MRKFFYITIPRSRKVKQSYFTSIFTSIWSILVAFCKLFKHRDAEAISKFKPPTFIKQKVSNGPGVCIPVFFVFFIYKVFWYFLLYKIYKSYYCWAIIVKQFSLKASAGLRIYLCLENFFIDMWLSFLLFFPRLNLINRFVV
jgi:hypothetical protein